MATIIRGQNYLSDGIAVYELDKKINNWSNTKTEWNSHFLEAPGAGKDLTAPYIGVSGVVSKKVYTQATDFKKVRQLETLHSHPDRIDAKQTEIYTVTKGAAALVTIQDNKPKIILIKEGESVIIQPGVKHCISAVKGDYEHLVCQVPSVFHEGFKFKVNHQYPDGYNEELVAKTSVERLDQAR